MSSRSNAYGNRLFLNFYLLIACLLVVNAVSRAEIPPENKNTPDRYPVPVNDLSLCNDDPLGDFQTLNIPLKRAGRLYMVEANVDGQTGNLIFDTGASTLVLNKTYFRKYAMFEKPSGGGITGTTGTGAQIKVNRIDISGLYYENVNADVADLAHIENRRGVKVLGLFGLNMIDNFEVIFDAFNNQLQLNRIDKNGNCLNQETKGIKFDLSQKIETSHNIMLVKGLVGEKPLNFCLDTGAETNVVSSDVSKKVMSTIEITRRSNVTGSGSAATEVLYGIMKDFLFGNQQLATMETIVTNMDAVSEAYGCKIDGLLGYDFWGKGVYRINIKKEEISIAIRKKGESQ